MSAGVGTVSNVGDNEVVLLDGVRRVDDLMANNFEEGKLDIANGVVMTVDDSLNRVNNYYTTIGNLDMGLVISYADATGVAKRMYKMLSEVDDFSVYAVAYGKFTELMKLRFPENMNTSGVRGESELNEFLEVSVGDNGKSEVYGTDLEKESINTQDNELVVREQLLSYFLKSCVLMLDKTAVKNTYQPQNVKSFRKQLKANVRFFTKNKDGGISTNLGG